MSGLIIYAGDAGRLPFPDGSIDEIVTSVPYWGQRSYEDDGEPIPGQLGGEPDWRDYLEELWRLTAEWARVLSPAGSLFVNIGDKHGDRGHGSNRGRGTGRGPQGGASLAQSRGPLEKSLMNLPHRYAIGVTDRLGLAQRAEIVWEKENPMPESVKDRVRRSHEHLFHFTAGRFYYQATDLIREALLHPGKSRTSAKARAAQDWQGEWKAKQTGLDGEGEHPLGRIPGSVWRIPTYPLKCPRYMWRPPGGGLAWLKTDRDAWRWLAETGADRSALPRDDTGRELRTAPDHYAAMPPDLVRPLVAAWSPERVCLTCRKGRFPVTEYTGEDGRRGGGADRYGIDRYSNLATASARGRAITGWACDCTPFTDLAGPRARSVTPRAAAAGYGRGDATSEAYADLTGSRSHRNGYPPRPQRRTWHLDGWEPPPSRPGRVLDPCGGTGTVALVAALSGRAGFTGDISLDYSRLATWRTRDPGERAAAAGTVRPPPVPAGQAELPGLLW